MPFWGSSMLHMMTAMMMLIPHDVSLAIIWLCLQHSLLNTVLNRPLEIIGLSGLKTDMFSCWMIWNDLLLHWAPSEGGDNITVICQLSRLSFFQYTSKYSYYHSVQFHTESNATHGLVNTILQWLRNCWFNLSLTFSVGPAKYACCLYSWLTTLMDKHGFLTATNMKISLR